MRKSATRTATRRVMTAGLATVATAAAVLGATATPALAVPMTLSQASGPSGGTNTMTGTMTTNILAGYANPVVYFTQATCPGTWTTTAFPNSLPAPGAANTGIVQASVVKKIADNKVAFTVPSGVVTVGSATSQRYNVCVYGAATASTVLAANATYSVSPPAEVTSITPSSGPSLGGTAMTVIGTGFPTAAGSIQATVGGVAATVTPQSATQFTITTPARTPASGTTLTITTASGTLYRTSAFDFINGVSVMPNTAAASQKLQDVDIMGTDFLNYNFTTGNSRVFLVNGNYNPIGSTTKTNPQVSECVNVLLVADNEIICTLILSQRIDSGANFAAEAAANAPVLAARAIGDGSIGNPTTGTPGTLLTVTAPTPGVAGFRSTDIGLPVTTTGTGQPAAGTTIAEVLSPTQAILSAAGTAGSNTAITVGGPRTLADVATTLNGRTVTAPANTFRQSDVGRQIRAAVPGTGIPHATVILSVNSDGTSATLSRAATSAVTGNASTVHNGEPVPDGAYNLTVVSNGGLYADQNAVDAAATAGTYKESVVSSGATFTVSPF